MANKKVTIKVTNWGTTLTSSTNITITANTGTTTPSSATLASLTGGTVVTIDESATSVSLTPVGECSGTTQTFLISANPSASGVITNYYRMGNCNEVQYSYTATTNTGFGIIVAPGCATADELETLIWSDPAHTTYFVDYNNPCPLPSFTGTTYVARYTGGTVGSTAVYNVSGVGCLSIISGETGPSYTVDLNDMLTTYVGAGIGACGISPCVGSTLSGNTVDVYDAQICNETDRILVADGRFDFFNQLTLSGVVSVNVFDITGYPLTGYCATIVSAYTETTNFYISTGVTPGTYSYSLVGANYASSGTTCGACDANHYLIRGTQTSGCDDENLFDTIYAWTTSGLSIGDIFTVTGQTTCTDHFCCYEVDYVSPGKLNKYSFNYVAGYAGPTPLTVIGDTEVFRVYDNCTTCTGDTFQTVIGVTGNTLSANEIDPGEVTADITLDSNVDINTSIDVEVTTSVSTYTVTINIPLGSSSGSGSTSTGSTDPGSPSSACVISSDNPMIDPDTFICSP